MGTPPPAWATHLIQLCRDVTATTPPAGRGREESWKILYFMIAHYARLHGARLGRLDTSDVDEIAAEKSLELIVAMDKGTGTLPRLSVGDVPRFLSTVARNGVVDTLKQKGRWESMPEHDDIVEFEEARVGDFADAQVQRTEFAGALMDCAEQLEERARRIWFFRVFYEMQSDRIARHPGVGLKRGHVDVIMQRTRTAVSKCMDQKGFAGSSIPRGVFVELWDEFQRRELL